MRRGMGASRAALAITPETRRKRIVRSGQNGATNGLAVERLALIPNDSEAARFQLLNVLEVAAAAMLFESQDEEITATAIDRRTCGVALSEQPDIGRVICRPVFPKKRDQQAL